MTSLIVTEPDHLVEVIKKSMKAALEEHEAEKKANESMKLFTINQVALKLGKAHATVSKMLRDGVLKGTVDGLIPEVELKRYLAGK